MALSALDLIQAVRERGGRFLLDGEKLGVSPRSAAEPFAEQIRESKREIIALLNLRLPTGVRLVKYAAKAAPVQLSPCSVVTDTEKFIGSTFRQLDARLTGKDWAAGNFPLSTLLARLEAVGVEVALDDPGKALQ